ncbi:FAD-dependent oxidoreductase [Pseudonocardia sp. HH130630-07]|uniref:FAD-dependent oxidoreductase n=1 Tax=Pseudonocardia sp. HH130630-07 TaxID=1690815 RepID=UPI000814EA50|nr:FAD-dependent monooxygenase [Pseudonocardia sp. HH130630-07]ANY05819.1 FAD-binding monooxygenase [Pseudonocardia sp. HH130630-07]
MDMHVVVVGGGIGGLALGAGLRRRGRAVTVLDRDVDVTATGGYHITLDGAAQSALAELVDPAVLRRLLASGSALRRRERDAFWDPDGRLLGHGPDLSDDRGVDVDRITLRTLLAEAVGDDLQLGRRVSGVEHGRDGDRPRVLFDDGAPLPADLVVGADGTHSVVARHLAGGPTNAPAGIVGFCGRTRFEDLGPAERARLGRRSGLTVGPRGAALYVGFLDPVGNAALDGPDAARLRMSVTTGPTHIWGAMFGESTASGALRGLHGADLQDALVHGFRERGWAGHTLEVVARADPATVAAFRFHAAATRAADLAPWAPGPVTALGDAVHATPPTAGMGAGAAIRDAAALTAQLDLVAAGTSTLTEAVRRFEDDLRPRGAEVVARGMATVHRILSTDGPRPAANGRPGATRNG